MKKIRLLTTAAISLNLLLLTACSSTGKITATNNENILLNSQYNITMSSSEALKRGIITKKDKQQTVLLISGGGGYGAYGAGVLNAWHEENMPKFDIVTGISTGALLATSAFINDDKSILAAKKAYTSTGRGDLISIKWFLFWRNSLSTATPLENIIKNSITHDMIDKVGAEYRKGRRLFVATTELNSNKLTIWDMGKVANLSQDIRYNAYYKILLASSSVPGFFPPVNFNYYNTAQKGYQIAHCDSTKRSMFIAPWMIATNKDLQKTKVFAILNNQVFNLQKREVKDNIIPLFATFIYDLINARAYFGLVETREITKKSNIKNEYLYCSIPGSVNLDGERMDFKTKDMNLLYQTGYQDIKTKKAWKSNIPLN